MCCCSHASSCKRREAGGYYERPGSTVYIGTTIEFVKLRALISGFYEFKCNSTVTDLRVTHLPSRGKLLGAEPRGRRAPSSACGRSGQRGRREAGGGTGRRANERIEGTRGTATPQLPPWTHAARGKGQTPNGQNHDKIWGQNWHNS